MSDRNRRWFLKAAGATIATTAIAGCVGDDDNGATDPDDVVVEVGDNFYDPAEVTIEAGETVHWEWVGSIDHDITPLSQPDDADWEGHPDLKSDGSYEYTFDVTGTYEYTCSPHAGMDGTIIVE